MTKLYAFFLVQLFLTLTPTGPRAQEFGPKPCPEMDPQQKEQAY